MDLIQAIAHAIQAATRIHLPTFQTVLSRNTLALKDLISNTPLIPRFSTLRAGTAGLSSGLMTISVTPVTPVSRNETIGSFSHSEPPPAGCHSMIARPSSHFRCPGINSTAANWNRRCRKSTGLVTGKSNLTAMPGLAGSARSLRVGPDAGPDHSAPGGKLPNSCKSAKLQVENSRDRSNRCCQRRKSAARRIKNNPDKGR